MPRAGTAVGRRPHPYRTLRRLPGANFGSGIYSRWPLDDLGSLKTGLGLRSAAADVHTPDGTVRFVALHPVFDLAEQKFTGRCRGQHRNELPRP